MISYEGLEKALKTKGIGKRNFPDAAYKESQII